MKIKFQSEFKIYFYQSLAIMYFYEYDLGFKYSYNSYFLGLKSEFEMKI